MKVILTCLLFLSISHKGYSWSLKTHLWIAEVVLKDVLDDGHIGLMGKKYKVPDKIKNALERHPEMFRMGSLGPDVFPDMIVGQVTTHPGSRDWPTDKWLKQVLSKATTDQEIAFAYGYTVHASCDVFAHTYVNMYAGDIFDLMDERTVEYRHFALEKFIEGYTPAIITFKGAKLDYKKDITAPFQFLSRVLVHDSNVYKRLPDTTAIHIRGMHNVRVKVTAFRDAVQNPFTLLQWFKEQLRESRAIKKSRQSVLKGSVEADKRSIYIRKKKIEAGTDTETDQKVVDEKTTEIAEATVEIGELEAEIADIDLQLTGSLEAEEHLGVITDLIDRWIATLDKSTASYMASSDSVARLMLYDTAGAMKVYKNWALCHAPVFAGVPLAASQGYCAVRAWLTETQADVTRFLEKKYPIYALVNELMAQLRIFMMDQMRPYLEKAGKWIITGLSDSTTAEFAYLMMQPEHATQSRLDSIFREDKSTKQLLLFDNVSSFIIRDMQVVNGKFNPDAFGPVANSITLSKLALLDPDGLNKIVQDVLPTYTTSPYGTKIYPSYNGNFTLLFDAVKSIDGNHQWQPYPLPYPKRNGAVDTAKNSYGYNIKDNKQFGFRFWADPYLRQHVFLKLFPHSALGSLRERAELQWPLYKFPECTENLYPTRASDSGVKLDKDCKCGGCN